MNNFINGLLGNPALMMGMGILGNPSDQWKGGLQGLMSSQALLMANEKMRLEKE